MVVWLPKVSTDGMSKRFQGGTHNDRCRRVAGQWLFEHMRVRLRGLP